MRYSVNRDLGTFFNLNLRNALFGNYEQKVHGALKWTERLQNRITKKW